MTRLAVMALLLGACVADDATPPTEVTILPTDDGKADDANTEAICAAAAALPATDACSLVCDPDAFKARLVDDGMPGGNCYQVRCDLAPEMSVTVGVCLP